MKYFRHAHATPRTPRRLESVVCLKAVLIWTFRICGSPAKNKSVAPFQGRGQQTRKHIIKSK
eukprot:7189636-Pyramimonas_sp.AAC.1